MLEKTQPDREFVELVQRVLNQEASLDDIAHLNTRLPIDPIALQYFVEMRMLHGALENELGSVISTEDLSSLEDRLIEFPGNYRSTTLSGLHMDNASEPLKQRLRFPLSIAAALIILSLIFIATDRILHRPAFEVVACYGSDSSSRLANGEWIRQGDTLKLASGVIEVRSPDGNSLTFQGPGDVKILNQRHLVLNSGRLWADLKGDPILIKVPRGEITDLGTTFGIDQSSPSTTRVDIFDGEVRFSEGGDSHLAVQAIKGESLTSTGATWTPEKGEADASLYTVGLRSPLAFTFAADQNEVERIESGLAFGLQWNATFTMAGSMKSKESPVEMTWAGARIYSTGASHSLEATILHTHLCGFTSPLETQQAARKVGLKNNGNGLIIQFTNIDKWLEQIGAPSYTLELYRNSGLQGGSSFFYPVSLFNGNPATSTLLGKLDSPKDNYLPADHPDGDVGAGYRLIQQFDQNLTANTLTLTTPVRKLPYRGNISGVVLRPVF